MKDKEMIEEIAWVIQNGCDYCNADCEFYNNKTYKKVFDKRLECENIKFAKNIINLDYQKIDKDSVVLSREKYNDFVGYKELASQRKYNLDYANVELRRLTLELNSAEESNAKANEFLEKYRKELEITKQQLAQASKETAEKFVKLLDEKCEGESDYRYSYGNVKEIVYEIANQLGAEIERGRQ